jgi:DNA adenine methylase
MHISNKISAFTYLGGKLSILPWLLPHLPKSKHFVDVFGGSAAVLINRDQSPIETYNDINHKVVNFFKVLRDTPEELIRVLELTPHSKYEYDNAWYSYNDDAIEKARKFFIRTQQSLLAAGGQDKVKGWATSIRESRVSISEKTHKWIRGVNGLWEIAERLKQVQIECRDFRFILRSYDDPNTLFYLDSPYDETFRSSSAYEFDFVSQDFFDMQYWAKKVSGKIAISGYNTPFMRELFKDFYFHHGPKRKNSKSDKDAYECLWTNYEPQKDIV